MKEKKKEALTHKITTIPMEFRLSYSKGMMDQYGKASLHFTLASVEVTDTEKKEKIGSINHIVGGGVEIRDKIRNETWVLSAGEVWAAYQKSRENCQDTDNEGRSLPKPKEKDTEK